MSSEVSSTRATCGSGCRSICTRNKPSPASVSKTTLNIPGKSTNNSSSSEGSTTVSQYDTYYIDRIASYLTDVNEIPIFEGIAVEDNIQVHITQMKSYLDTFDDIMTNSER